MTYEDGGELLSYVLQNTSRKRRRHVSAGEGSNGQTAVLKNMADTSRVPDTAAGRGEGRRMRRGGRGGGTIKAQAAQRGTGGIGLGAGKEASPPTGKLQNASRKGTHPKRRRTAWLAGARRRRRPMLYLLLTARPCPPEAVRAAPGSLSRPRRRCPDGRGRWHSRPLR